MMEADVTKTQHLANNLPNNPVSVGLHPVAGQGQVLDNHNWKPVEAQDSQSTINHVQEMLDQMSARGIQSMLVTVGPFGEIGVHGSQKGQLFLKENSDIGDRFAKMCTDMIDIAGTQREQELEDRNSNTDYSVPEHEDDTDCGDDSCVDETPKTNTEEQEDEKTNLETNVCYNTRSMKKSGKLSRGTKSKMPVQKGVKVQRTDSGTGMPNLEVFDENIAERSIRIENRSPSKKSKKSDLLSLGRKTDAINKDNQKLQKLTSTTPTKVSRTYNCKKCNEPFASTVAHNRHLRSKVCFIKNKYDNDFEKVTCKQCKLVFLRQEYLDVHMAVHEESVPQNFDVKFTDISKQISDIEVKEDTSPLKCKTCGQQFKEKRLLLHHTIIMHGMSFKCKVCEATFETKYKCWSHQRLHEDRSGKSTAKSTFHCKYCSMTFSAKSALEQHYISCHSEGSVTSFPCDKCKKAFSNESFLEQHKVKMHGKKFVCTHEGCNKSFTSLYILEQHSLTHEERSFMCSICGKLFNNRRNFNAHSTVHENERRYECDVCKKTYKTSDVLSKHKRIHAATRRFYCDICGWGFNQSGTLKKHLNSHLNIKKYQCEVCSQKFANKASLTNHKLLQGHFVPGSDNEKGVIKAKKCEYCDKLFPPGSTYMYKRHVVIHTGVKAHTCDFCGKSFSDRSNLKYHRLTHVEDKPFVCSVCGRGFIQKRGLRKHLESSASCNKSNIEMNQQFRDDSGADTLVSAFHRPTSIPVNTDDTDMVIAASTSEDVAQRQVPVYVQESFSSEAVEAVMGISGTEQGTNIPRNVLDLSGNSSAEEGAWIYAKQWN